MTSDLPLQCACGQLRGVARRVGPREGCRLVCMCDDCQTAAHHLGCAAKVLDPHGGTEVFQMTPSQLELSAGAEHLRCLRLSPKGLMRWYAGCCSTPVANGLPSPKVPFVGIIHTFMAPPEGLAREQILGPILGRINGRFGHGELPPDAHPKAPAGVLFRTGRTIFAGWIRRRHRPSPLFDPSTGKPVVEPTVASLDERERALALAKQPPPQPESA